MSLFLLVNNIIYVNSMKEHNMIFRHHYQLTINLERKTDNPVKIFLDNIHKMFIIKY